MESEMKGLILIRLSLKIKFARDGRLLTPFPKQILFRKDYT